MKKIDYLAKSIFALCLIMGTATMEAQVEFKILTGFGTRFNDVNDNGTGITETQYFDFASEELTDLEAEATGLTAINNNGEVAGQMFYDEPNFIMQPAFFKDGTWSPIGWFTDANPAESSFSTYEISPNGKYVVGQMSKGCCDYGTFLFDTEEEELYEIFDVDGETLTGYTVTNDGLIGGWLNVDDNGNYLRVPAFFNKEGDITLVSDGELPELNVNAINAINESNIMVGDFDGKPFFYDLSTETFTTFNSPEGNTATFTSISENGISIGYEDVAFQVREAIIYHPVLGDQPVYLKDVLEDLGVTISTLDGRMGTAYKISPNGNYVVGWVNGPPPFAEGWMVNLDDMILLGNQQFSENKISFYPNPVSDILYLNSNETIDSVVVYSATGKMISNINFNKTRSELSLSNLANGVYLVKVMSGGNVENLKVVKH